MQPSQIQPRPTGTASVTLCMARLQDISVADTLALLSASELERARRITHQESWLHFVTTRGLLRLMLGHCTGSPPGSVALADGGEVAPRLVNNPDRLHFNVSHSADWVCVAIGRSELGVDIERILTDCDWETIAETFFHPKERELLRTARLEARRETFFEIWTRKEAYLKGIGLGLSGDPSSFNTASLDGAVAIEGPAASGRKWYTLPISAPAGYKAALASGTLPLAITRVDLATVVQNVSCPLAQRA